VALEPGVEQRAAVVCLQEPPRERGNIGISHSTYNIRKRNRGWMAIQKGSSLVVDEWTAVCRGANDNVIATDIRRRVEKRTRIVNVYDQSDGPLGERPA